MLFVIYCNARDSNEARLNPTVYLTTNRQTQMKHKNPFLVLATIAVVLKHTAYDRSTNTNLSNKRRELRRRKDDR